VPTGLGVLPVTGEGFAPGQHQVDADGAHALDHADAARQLALHGAGLADALLEAGGGQRVGAVEDFVADAAAGRQALLGQQQPGAGNLVGGDQDAAAGGVRPVRDVGAVQLIDDLAGLAQLQVGIQQRHRRLGAMHRQPTE